MYLTEFTSKTSCQEISDEVRVLWYAFGINEPSDLYDLAPHVDVLTRLLYDHRAAYAFLNRLAMDCWSAREVPAALAFDTNDYSYDVLPRWCSQTFISSLKTSIATSADRVREQAVALDELVQNLPDSRMQIIALKGFAVNDHLHRDPRIRPTADLDLLVPDLSAAWRVLVKLGYEIEHEFDKHEFAVCKRGRTTIEVHSHFPLWSYSETMPTLCVDGKFHVVEAISDEPSIIRLTYTDILEHSQRSTYAKTPLAIPNMEMCAIILMSHMLRNYIYSPLKSHTAVKMYELADLKQLLQSERFSKEKFRTYVSQFQCEQALSFTYDLLHKLFGQGWIDSVQYRVDQNKKYPRRIILDSFLRCGWFFPGSRDKYFAHQDLQNLLDDIPHETLSIVEDGSLVSKQYYCSQLRAQEQRFMVFGDKPERLDFAVKMRKATGQFVLSFNIREKRQGQVYYIGIYFPQEIRQWLSVTFAERETSVMSNLPRDAAWFDHKRGKINFVLTRNHCACLDDSSFSLMIVLSQYIDGVPYKDQKPSIVLVPLVVDVIQGSKAAYA